MSADDRDGAGVTPGVSGSSLTAPSRFWQRLNAEHEQALGEFGADQCKRRQALRYFTWRWTWSQVHKSEQFRFLISHTSPRQWLACARAPMDLSDEAWAGVEWPKADRWLYCFATRLLWEYARPHDVLGVLDLLEPDLGSPLPVWWRGRLISQDLANGALEAAAISRALGGASPEAVLEVGAGYGRTGYALLSVFPEATYTIVDIEPARLISCWYLSPLFPERSVRWLSPTELIEGSDERFDLALSISSLQEMTAEQQAAYLTAFDRRVQGGTVFLKQWHTWRNPDDGLTSTFDGYPVPARWSQLFKERAPVQTRFVQAAWKVPGR